MRDITYKNRTHRIAIAEAIVEVSPESIKAIKENTTTKPDVLPTARASAFLAVKNTPYYLPHCHNIPIEYVQVDFELLQDKIKIIVEVHSIYKTGCEMEALHGASNAALVIYDMLKPMDNNIEIKNIRLVEKRGGKSDFKDDFIDKLKAAVIVCSDSIFAGKKQDKAGKFLVENLQKLNIEVKHYDIIPDDVEKIREFLIKYVDEEGIDLIIYSGGTGLSPRDKTPEAIEPLLDRSVSGIMEHARRYGMERTPYAMLSRGVAGTRKKSLILTFPGSTKGTKETFYALFPAVLHILKVINPEYRHHEKIKR